MQDQPLDDRCAGAPAPIEHLDLVTAELRRRIAGIGLAIAELREETSRLRASADDRYPAVAVLDRRSCDGDSRVGDPLVGDGDTAGTPLPTIVEPAIGPTEATVVVGDVLIGAGPVEPVPPWGDESPGATAESALAWVPASEPIGVVDPAAAVSSPASVDVGSVARHAAASDAEVGAPVPVPAAQVVSAEEAPSLWVDGDDHDAAAFEAFFSAEIEPEPSQRWLLSD